MANKAIVDYSLSSNGETASPLQQLIQEIETIIVSDADLVTMPGEALNLNQYLFKYGLSEIAIAQKIQRLIDKSVMNPEGYGINVSVKFMKGLQKGDTMIIDTEITLHGQLQQRLTYAIQP